MSILQRGGNGRNGDGSWPETDGRGCPVCGAVRNGGHGGGCPGTGTRYAEDGTIMTDPGLLLRREDHADESEHEMTSTSTPGPDLDDKTRTVETVACPGPWERAGDVTAVAVWLGNATQADRDRITARARKASETGRSLRITFPGVRAFFLGYAGGGTYKICVPGDKP